MLIYVLRFWRGIVRMFYELAVAQVLAWVESHLHVLHKVAGKLGLEEVAPAE